MRFQSLTHLARATQRALKRLHSRHASASTSQVTAGGMPQPTEAHRAQANAADGGECDVAGTSSADLAPNREQRVHAWRRRVLLKKGARLHAASMDRGDHCSLAMLDSDGIVVAWYDDSTDSSRVGVHVVDRHVSQFYVPADLAANLPGVNLLSAAICGGNTQQGWRRQPGGAIVWAMTVIEAVVLKDGRLQGFTHVVRTAEGPRAEPPIQMPQPSFRKSTNVRWGMNRAPIGVSHASAAA